MGLRPANLVAKTVEQNGCQGQGWGNAGVSWPPIWRTWRRLGKTVAGLICTDLVSRRKKAWRRFASFSETGSRNPRNTREHTNHQKIAQVSPDSDHCLAPAHDVNDEGLAAGQPADRDGDPEMTAHDQARPKAAQRDEARLAPTAQSNHARTLTPLPSPPTRDEQHSQRPSGQPRRPAWIQTPNNKLREAAACMGV